MPILNKNPFHQHKHVLSDATSCAYVVSHNNTLSQDILHLTLLTKPSTGQVPS